MVKNILMWLIMITVCLSTIRLLYDNFKKSGINSVTVNDRFEFVHRYSVHIPLQLLHVQTSSVLKCCLSKNKYKEFREMTVHHAL